MNGPAISARRRRWQRPTPPVDLPQELRARLNRTNPVSLAERFRREEIFAEYRPKLAIALAQDHMNVAGDVRRDYYVPPAPGKSPDLGSWRNSWDDARAYTKGQHATLQAARLGRAFDEQDIRDYADNYAGLCSRMLTREHREDFTRSQNIDPPEGKRLTSVAACARMDDPQWWRRKLRAAWTRRAENVMRELGIVRKGRETYASDDAVQARAIMKARGRRFLEAHAVVNEEAEQLSLLDVAGRSLANPALRRGEFMCRVRGFEEISLEAGHVAQFWTLTTPSAYHAWNATGDKNANFGRFTVREGQEWLCKQWGRVRAKLKRLKIIYYGFRIAEPHHDGTPHWHLLIWCKAVDAPIIERIVRHYWLKDYADEAGAAEFRVKCKAIDPEQGSAVGYIAKYVSKNIDGAGAIGAELDDETAKPIPEGIKRVDAWASLHRIRQFQQLGGPPVGLWRELRRLREPVYEKPIERARLQASEHGSFAGMVREVGGIEAGRRTSVRVWKSNHGGISRYEDVRVGQPIGVMAGAMLVRCRHHKWQTVRAGSVPKGQAVVRHYAGPHRAGDALVGGCHNVEFWPAGGRLLDIPIHTFRSGVMNPPRSAALGREAGNPIAQAAGETKAVGIPPGGAYPVEGTGGARPALPVSFSWEWNAHAERFQKRHGRYPNLAETLAVAEKIRSGSGSEFPLGPVAITVRGAPGDHDTS